MHWPTRLTTLGVLLGALLLTPWLTSDSSAREGFGRHGDGFQISFRPTLSFPFALDGGGYKSDLVIKNNGSRPVELQVVAHDTNGDPWRTFNGGLNYKLNLTVPRDGLRTLTTSGGGSTADAGWLYLERSRRSHSNLLTELQVLGGNTSTELPLTYNGLGSAQKYCFGVSWKTTGATPTLHVSNPNARPVQYRSSILDSDGMLWGTPHVSTIPAMGCETERVTDVDALQPGQDFQWLVESLEGSKFGLSGFLTYKDDFSNRETFLSAPFRFRTKF